MATKKELLQQASVSLMIFGGLLVFFSLAIVVADPENGRSAFPYPSGVPGLIVLAIGVVTYLVSGRARAVKSG